MHTPVEPPSRRMMIGSASNSPCCSARRSARKGPSEVYGRSARAEAMRHLQPLPQVKLRGSWPPAPPARHSGTLERS